ncbi:MAG: tRNA pseudouridine(38-40) synthase TruA [Alphaproteobacteria bacterium]|nr:tRNA pseudouridine(38-40) synthase TruA [Alphaproteobacteria bacterium]
MPRYKLTLEYDGSPYSGWQKQSEAPSVQAVLEQAATRFMNAADTIEVQCAGRTDAGVHARGQVAHVDFAEARAANAIVRGLNALMMPHPIAVLSAEPVADDFSARFDAQKRHYLYRITNRKGAPALDVNRTWHVHKPLNIEAMQRAAHYLVGHHDFSSFRGGECQAKSPLKTLDTLEVKQRSTNPEQVMIRTSAKSFLHHQVRNMVGTLVYVGIGKWQVERVAEALAARDRRAGGPMAPAHGLYLMNVEY